ncbi:MAG TPA: MFS transporter [Steroidobacteraceae bacterium]|nr:MFS transporter [Steroidobacteraceae bacterium]
MSQAFRAAEPAASLSYRSYVLAVLVLVYTFNFIDRQIVGILAVPIKAELHLSDSQLGLMGGLAFALFYTLLGIPIARLADRVNRTGIMTAALALWSLMTAMCGFTHNFAQLFAARVGVGVGEAGGVAPAYSLICDYFPMRERARALSVYSFGIPIGSAVGIVLGGFITSLMSWRMAFFIVGLAGLLLTPLLKLTVREPVRGALDPERAARESADHEPGRLAASLPSILVVAAVLARKPSFWGLSLGAASASMMGYGLFFWAPSFLVRSFHLTVLHASLVFGALVLAGGLAGIWSGGVLADRYGEKRRGMYAYIPALAFLATVPFYLAGVLSTTLSISFAVLLVPTALGLLWLGPVLAAVQHLVPGHMRATASALFLFINNLIGIGLGTTLIGVVSDAMRLRFGAESLRYAILAGTGFYLIAAALLFFAGRNLARDWVGEAPSVPPGL